MPASASDWTRFKRLVGTGRAGREINVITNTDVNSPPTRVSSARDGFRPDQGRYGGIGRTRREASKWTDYVASQQANFITQRSGIFGTFVTFGIRLMQLQICADSKICPPASVLPTKVGIRTSAIYQRSRIL